MAELTRALDAAFRVRFSATEDGDAAMHSSSSAGREDALAAQQWVRTIHTAFYAPAARGQSGNKFLELETALTPLLQLLSQDEHNAAGFAAFMVRVVLLLCQDPTPSESASRNGGGASGGDLGRLVGTLSVQASETTDQTTGTRVSKKLRKKNKTNAQPNTPLAFIVVNALKNLTLGGGSDAKRLFQHQGKSNAALIAFCTKGLEDARSMVRMYLCILAHCCRVIALKRPDSFCIEPVCSSRTRSWWWKCSTSSASRTSPLLT